MKKFSSQASHTAQNRVKQNLVKCILAVSMICSTSAFALPINAAGAGGLYEQQQNSRTKSTESCFCYLHTLENGRDRKSVV